jgi:hypothetical protein
MKNLVLPAIFAVLCNSTGLTADYHADIEIVQKLLA